MTEEQIFHRALVVSSSRFLQQQIHNILIKINIEISGELTSVRDAVQTIINGKYHIVIVDMFMPDASGTDLIKKFSNHLDEKFFILISALQSKNIIVDAIKSGAFDFLPQPLQQNHLIQSVLRIQNRINNYQNTAISQRAL